MGDPTAVRTPSEFAAFVDHLRADLTADPSGWENADLPRFLEALSAYVRDMPGHGKSYAWAVGVHSADWRVFAMALAGARVYE